MRDARYESVLNDPRSFRPQSEYRFIEVTADGDPSATSYKEGKLKEDEVAAWAQGVTHARHRSRILQVQRSGPRDNKSKQSLTLVVFPNYTGKANPSSAALQLSIKQSAKHDLVCKFGGLADLALTYDVATKTTSLFIALRKRLLPVFDAQASSEAGGALIITSYLPIIVLEWTTSSNMGSASNLRAQISRVRSSLDMNPYKSAMRPQGHGDTEIDLLENMKELTKLSQVVAQFRLDIGLMNANAEAIRLLHDKLLRTYDTAHSSDHAMKHWYELSAKLESVRCSLSLLEKSCDVYNAEVQGLVQTVYTLVSLRDNASNQAVAEASLVIAQDSRKVAILTRQDSTDMRVIAGATLVFLPATFVATLFSTDFFNFAPSGTSLISHWIWLYFIVTIALTGVVMLIWRQVARARDKETVRLLNLKDHELSGTVVDEEEGGDAASGSATSGIALNDLEDRLRVRKRTQAQEPAGSN